MLDLVHSRKGSLHLSYPSEGYTINMVELYMYQALTQFCSSTFIIEGSVVKIVDILKSQ